MSKWGRCDWLVLSGSALLGFILAFAIGMSGKLAGEPATTPPLVSFPDESQATGPEPFSMDQADRAFDATTARGKLEWARWILKSASASEMTELWERFSKDRTAPLLHYAILARWSQVDPEGGLAYLSEHSTNKGIWNLEPFNGRSSWALLGLNLARNFGRAQHDGLKFLYEHSSGRFLCKVIEPHLEERNRFELGGLYHFAYAEPDAALAWAKAIPQPRKRVDAVTTVLEMSDPATGLDFLETLPPSDERQVRRKRMLRALAAVDLDAALARLDESEMNLVGECTSARINKLTENKRFREALELLPADENYIRDNIFEQWVKSDQTAGLAYLDGLSKEAPHCATLTHTAISALSEQNPSEAWQRLNAISAVKDHSDARGLAAANLYRDDPEGTVSMIEALSHENQRIAAWSGIIAVEADRNPIQAMALVDALPNSPARTMAAENVFRRCLSIDREVAIDWAMQQPLGNTADRMFTQLAQAESYAQPAASLEWAAAIGDPDQQEKAARQILFDRSQLWRNPYELSNEERLRFIEQSSLTDNTKTLLRETVEKLESPKTIQ